MATPLIIDTDVALGVIWEDRPRDIDDGFALIEAVNLDAIDLKAVTTVFGNGPLLEVDRVARTLMDMKGVDVPIATGAAAAIGSTDDTNDAVELIAAELADGPRHIAAIGPLTNIGLLVERHPDRLTNIESVVIVGGRTDGNRFYLGGHGPVRDFNVENDMVAAERLLASGVPVVMAGFELTSQVVVTRAHLDTILAHGTAIARFVHAESLPWLAHVLERFPDDGGFHPWDSAAVQWLAHPERFLGEPRAWRVHPSPDEPDTAWLATSPDLTAGGFHGGDRPTVTFLTGFAPGGAEALVDDIVATVR